MATRGNAPAGALAAALAAIEIQKLLDGDRVRVAAGREVLLDAGAHVLSVSKLVRNPRCRFDHARWTLRPSANCTLREALARCGDADAALSVPGAAFLSRIACSLCGREEAPWSLLPTGGAPPCPHCGAPRAARGFDLVERVRLAELPSALADRPLSERGLRSAEVFRVSSADGGAEHFVLDAPTAAPAGGADLLIAGLGNIGSFLVPLLARLRGVDGVVLCDPDAYEADQLSSQDMRPDDAGQNKARAQAARLRALRPDLRVAAHPAAVETLPAGALASAIAVSCLDTRLARLRLGARAWHMDRPFVDAAVGGGDSLLARTNIYLPDAEAACIECAFDASDYAALEQIYPCGAVHDRAVDPGGATWTTS